MTPIDTANIQLQGDDAAAEKKDDGVGIPTAVGNPALPPQSAANASLAIPLHAQFAAASKDGYPIS